MPASGASLAQARDYFVALVPPTMLAALVRLLDCPLTPLVAAKSWLIAGERAGSCAPSSSTAPASSESAVNPLAQAVSDGQRRVCSPTSKSTRSSSTPTFAFSIARSVPAARLLDIGAGRGSFVRAARTRPRRPCARHAGRSRRRLALLAYARAPRRRNPRALRQRKL